MPNFICTTCGTQYAESNQLSGKTRTKAARALLVATGGWVCPNSSEDFQSCCHSRMKGETASEEIAQMTSPV